MKKYFPSLIFFLVLISSVKCFGQSGQWVWVRGDTLFGQYTNAALWGVEDSSYNPDALYLASTFKDSIGRFYIFGGATWDTSWNDHMTSSALWRYNPVTNLWALLKFTWDPSGIYGTEGIPDSSNGPGNRFGSTIWEDHLGHIWMFGGGTSGYSYSDLWKYNIATNNWTWMKGPDHWEIPGVYGFKGISDSINNPSPRREAVGWVDSDNNLWMFGGFNTYYNIDDQYRNDLWMYNTVTNEWTWQGGDSLVNSGGASGNKGIPNTIYFPRSRACTCSWSDDSDNFYLYGGRGGPINYYTLGDVWRYNRNTKEWTWLSGPLQEDSAGTIGSYCDAQENFFPTTRQQATCVKLDSSKIFLFGGLDRWWHAQYISISNDAWIYDFKQNKWSIVWGDLPIYPGKFGIQGVYDSTNNPRSRYGAISWKGKAGTVWIYGGDYYVDDRTQGDLWKFTLDTNCVSFNVADAIHQPSIDANIFPNPAHNSFQLTFPSSNKNSTLTIYNLFGEKIFSQKLNGEKEIEVDISKFAAGVYVVEINSSQQHFISKLIKQ